jgi:FixJ family two-component response regulator
MKGLPEEQKMLEILELAQDFERSAREMCELATAIAHKYQKLTSKELKATLEGIETTIQE